MSSTTSSQLSSVITRLESSPVRRRIMTPTPLVLATRQSSTEDEDRSVDSTPVRGVKAVVVSPKSTPLKSSLKSDRSDRSIRRQMSEEYQRLMSDNKNTNTKTSPPKVKINRENGSTRSKASDNQSNGEIISDIVTSSPPPVKECNKYGFFLDSDKAESLPELKKRDLSLLMRREKKWLHMLDHWDKYIKNKWEVVRNRCRKGIPHSLRGHAWLYLCGGHHQIKLHPNAYEDLRRQTGNEQVMDEIRKDLHRQFPTHEMFATRNGTGQTNLYNVLKAFSILKPDIGYCQGQAPIASVLLMHMSSEHAFWSLVGICDHYLPGYFSPGLEAIQLHGDMLFAFLKRFSPKAHKLMEKQKIEPILFMTEWFMCIFARTLPWTSVLRVWDMFLCEGIIVVFKVAIILVKETLRNQNKKTCPSMYETLEKLRNIPEEHKTETFLVERVLKLELDDKDLQREHNIQEKRRRKQKTNNSNSNSSKAHKRK